MQPLGRRKLRFPGKVDHHPRPKHKYINWWEDEFNSDENKGGERRRVKDNCRKHLGKIDNME